MIIGLEENTCFMNHKYFSMRENSCKTLLISIALSQGDPESQIKNSGPHGCNKYKKAVLLCFEKP